MKQLESQPFQSKLNLNSEEFENNKSSMLEMISELNELLDEAEAGGGPDPVSYTHLTLPTTLTV